ncbi:MAG: type II toxin-antitoxin system PemK/MazF family toxin [Fibromonadales bacterium]|nr:type II toxin-antitoxin system PemK/MazF family toxin [Fibromonadales bacterium]
MKQYDIYLANLDPTVGREIKKTRPCIIISPDEMNNGLSTVIIAPMTTKSHNYPSRVQIEFQNKTGWAVLDQIRAIDKIRLVKALGKLNVNKISEIKNVLNEMLVR